VLTQVEQDIERRAAELEELIATTIAELNALLEGQPKVLSGWTRGRRVSQR
jgi:hypothetical protein